jgi:biopolymer transport protein ExbD/biopolymer transport protein TolR
MGMSAGGKQGVKADINVTPLVDVVLVLLIIFMVVTPMLQRGKDVKLPSASKRKDEEGKKPDVVIVSVTKDRKTYVEKEEFAGDEALKDGLKAKLAAQPFIPILLKADVTLSFGDVRKVMNDIRQAGAKGVKLGVEEKKE